MADYYPGWLFAIFAVGALAFLFIHAFWVMDSPTQSEEQNAGGRVPYVTTELATAVMRAEHILSRDDRIQRLRDMQVDGEQDPERKRRDLVRMLRITAIHLESEGCALLAKAVQEAIEIVEKEAARA